VVPPQNPLATPGDINRFTDPAGGPNWPLGGSARSNVAKSPRDEAEKHQAYAQRCQNTCSSKLLGNAVEYSKNVRLTCHWTYAGQNCRINAISQIQLNIGGFLRRCHLSFKFKAAAHHAQHTHTHTPATVTQRDRETMFRTMCKLRPQIKTNRKCAAAALW